jgi:hypothetical protein
MPVTVSAQKFKRISAAFVTYLAAIASDGPAIALSSPVGIVGR